MTEFTFKLGQPSPIPTRQPQAEPIVNDKPSIGLMPIVSLLHNAKRNLKWPKLLIDTDVFGGLTLRLSIAGDTARWPGSINVTDNARDFDQRRYFGKIGLDGKWHGSPRIPLPDLNEVFDELLLIASDPLGYAKIHGRRYSNCMFCGKELTHPDSLTVGYGPICAEKWGLPWEGMAKQVAAEKRQAQTDEALGDFSLTDETPKTPYDRIKDAEPPLSETLPDLNYILIDELIDNIKVAIECDEVKQLGNHLTIHWPRSNELTIETRTNPPQKFKLTIEEITES